MRLLHTSDWHLGHLLHEHDRGSEHDAFLAWLLRALADHEVDALLIAGDVFETANPHPEALRRWYTFLAEARRRCPALDIVVIGGNHDSPARLDAPRELLDALGVHVVGGVPRRADGSLALERMVAPVRDRDGAVGAWVAAVPYLRVADLPRVEGDDPLIAGVREVYASVLDLARSRRGPGQALVAMGHCYMTGTAMSELSERKVLGGNLHGLPVDLFPDDVAYTALGHLHLAQEVGSPRVRYAGSPIPLSFAEAGYPHQVLLVELRGGALAGVEPLRVPRTVDLLRLPTGGPGGLAEALAALAALPVADGPGAWPFLELRVSLERPEPGLRRAVDEALKDRAARLASLRVTHTGTGAALGPSDAGVVDLQQLQVEEVFRRCWSARYREPPGAAQLEAFHELVELARRGA